MSNGKQKKSNNPNVLSESAKRLKERREARQSGRGDSEPADWQSVDPDLVISLIAKFTAHGGVISFGYNRAGTVYRVGFFSDGESDTLYIRPSEDIDKEIEYEIERWK